MNQTSPRHARPLAPRRASHRAFATGVRGGFTMIELLVAIGITLILMAIVGELLSQVRQSVGIGTANGEIITYAGALETRIRDDFRRLDTRSFMAIKWANNGASATIPVGKFTVAAGVITAIDPPDLVAPFNVNAAGLDTRTDLSVENGGADPTRTVIDLVISDTTGTGAKAIAYVDAGGQITSIKVIRGGANYTAPTARVIGPAIDQIAFIANGPWVTSRYGIQTTNVADAGYKRTFQSPSARVWYGHLAATTNSPYGGYLIDRDENDSPLSPRQLRLGRHGLLISPEVVRYDFPGNSLASQSIWQLDNVVVLPVTRYGVRPGYSDVAMLGDAASIQTIITDINNLTGQANEPLGHQPVGDWGATRLPGQRMGDAVFRIYGTPYAPAPTAITPESHMLNQSLISANCSGFKIEVSNDGTFTDLAPRPTSPSVFCSSGTGLGGGLQNSDLTLLDGGKDLDPNNTVLEVIGGGGSGATLTPTFAGGILTGVAVNNPGTGYTSAPRIVATTTYAAGYGLGTGDHCQPMPRLVRVTVTLHDQRGRIHDLYIRDPSFNDGRTYSYVLDIPPLP